MNRCPLLVQVFYFYAGLVGPFRRPARTLVKATRAIGKSTAIGTNAIEYVYTPPGGS